MKKHDCPQEEPFLQKKIIRRAMHLLERMDRTEHGLREKLARSQYPQEMIEEAIVYVKSYGYIDDFRYAVNYIGYRLECKSRQQIFAALRKKGVERDICAAAWEIATAEGEPDEKELICTLIRKRCKDKRELTRKEYLRLQGYLGRRGFPWEKVASAMDAEGISMATEG